MPDPILSSTTPESSSPIIQRLERCQNESVGLVNLLNFQPRAAKIPQAIVQRAALVQQLQTRYGTHTNEIAGSELVLANPPDLEVPSDTLSTVANSIAKIKQEGKRQEPERQQSKAELIQRSPANTSLPSASFTLKQESTREENRERSESQLMEKHQNFPSTQPKTQSTSPINPSPEGQFRVSRKVIPKISQMNASPTIKAKLETRDSVKPSVSTTKVQPPLRQMTTASTPSLPLSKAEVIQRSPVDTSIPSTSSNPSVVKAGLTSTANSLPVVFELPSSSLLLQRVNDEDVVDLGYIDFPSFDNSARAADSLLPFRQNVQRINLQENSNVNIEGIGADYARTNPRTKNAPAAFPLNTGSVYESVSAERSFSTLVPAPVRISKEPQTPPQEIDVAQIAEQVSRNLFRQLRIERERRGFSR
ncbi:hypothetical protein F7734_12490 [Scytonema sp. UIC 10036]|uniref:hypothetical protein n=1 Tax=Scytonema sp. UIC 10036 TaxID=2304196 RepID=UPI0012DA1553|nr:hypothetical protein [Scytonema sp. UIC 10036]MUG93205.1 hypothetical protein [Scytonema sp. UIC 10036]